MTAPDTMITSGPSAVGAYVQLMYDHGVDVLLKAHNHQYERFA